MVHIFGQNKNRNPLNAKKTAELVDILRRNFLYQTTWRAKDGNVVLKMVPEHFDRLIELIHAAGGWDLPEEVKAAMIAQAKAAKAEVDEEATKKATDAGCDVLMLKQPEDRIPWTEEQRDDEEEEAGGSH